MFNTFNVFSNYTTGQIIISTLWLMLVGLGVNLWRWCDYDKSKFWLTVIALTMLLSIVSLLAPVKYSYVDITKNVAAQTVSLDKLTYLVYRYPDDHKGVKTTQIEGNGGNRYKFTLESDYSYFGLLIQSNVIPSLMPAGKLRKIVDKLIIGDRINQ